MTGSQDEIYRTRDLRLWHLCPCTSIIRAFPGHWERKGCRLDSHLELIKFFSLQWLDWNHCRSIKMFAFGKKWNTKKEIKLQNTAVVPSCGDKSYHNQSIFAHYFFFGWEAEKSIARSPTKFLYWKRTKTTKNCHGNIVELDLSANFRAYLEDARGPEPTAD